MLVSPQETRLIAERIPGALIPTIPEAGHLPNLERPDTFNELLMQFMTEWVSGSFA
jgi:pimeloyl-ACP methyl ester carboxylesterase